MSLIHWWPLNGDLEDYGLNPIKLTSNSTNDYAYGKIGRCRQFTSGSSYLYINGDMADIKTNVFTFSGWFYLTQLSSTTQWVFCLNNNSALGDCSAGLYVNDSSINYGQGGNAFLYSISLAINRWYHWALTCDGTKLRLYLDGNLLQEQNAITHLNRTKLMFSSRFGASGYNLFGYMNDLRIYDSCLNTLEIKELSRALIAHYPLNNNGHTQELPSAYQRVEYIEATGTQRINTGVTIASLGSKYTIDTTVKLKDGFDFSGAANTQPSPVGLSNGAFQIYWHSNTLSFWTNQGAINFAIDPANAYDQYRIKLECDNLNFTMWANDRSAQNKQASAPYTVSTVYLCSYNSSGSYAFHGRIYTARLLSSEKVVFNGVPCYRKSDGKPGLYDLVNGQFLVNSGSGEFLLGPSIGVPSEYQQVEYLESTGTQYINTNYYFNNETDTAFIDTQYTSDHRGMVLGNRWDTKNCFALYLYTSELSVWYWGNTGSGSNAYGLANSSSSPELGRHNFKYYKNSLEVDGNKHTGGTSYTYGVSEFPIYIFNETKGNWPAKAKVYSTKILKSGVAQRDFIPCYRKVDSKPGMYDVINHVFYVNSGSGEFIVGPRKRMVGEGTVPTKTNQLFSPYDSGTGSGYGLAYSVDKIAGVYRCSGTITSQPPYFTYYPTIPSAQRPVKSGEYYAFILKVVRNDYSPNSLYVCSPQQVSYTQVFYSTDCGIYRMNADGNPSVYVNINTYTVGKQFNCYFRAAWVNLTDLYGAGNEPKSREEIKATKPWLLECEDYYPVGSKVVEPFYEYVLPPASDEMDVSGYRRNGTRAGALEWTQKTPRYGCGTRFDGATTYINTTPNNNLWQKALTSGYTISLWVNIKQHSDKTQSMYSCTQSGGMNIFVRNNNKLGTNCFLSGSYVEANDSNDFVYGKWHHVVAVWNMGVSLSLYLDGVLLQATPTTSTQHTYNNTAPYLLGLGVSTVDGSYLNGSMSDVRVYATALSQNDILDLYHLGCVKDASGNYTIRNN